MRSRASVELSGQSVVQYSQRAFLAERHGIPGRGRIDNRHCGNAVGIDPRKAEAFQRMGHADLAAQLEDPRDDRVEAQRSPIRGAIASLLKAST